MRCRSQLAPVSRAAASESVCPAPGSTTLWRSGTSAGQRSMGVDVSNSPETSRVLA